jgi:hypothetical protein
MATKPNPFAKPTKGKAPKDEKKGSAPAKKGFVPFTKK